MDNMQRAVLVRRFLLLLGDLHTHQLRSKRPEDKDQPKRPRYDSQEKSWYPKVPALLLGEAPNDIMKQVGVALTRWMHMCIVTVRVILCAIVQAAFKTR